VRPRLLAVLGATGLLALSISGVGGRPVGLVRAASGPPPDPRPPGASGEAPAAPSPVSVEASASRNVVTVGERFTIEVKATGPAGTEYTFPAGASEEAFELETPRTGAGSPAPAGEPANGAPSPGSGTHRYEAAVFALGEAEIPSIPVRYRLPDGTEGEAATKPLAVKVASLLPKDPKEQKLADVRPPQPASIGRAFWLALVASMALAAALVTWWWRRRRAPAAALAPPVPALPPDVEALRALDALAASDLLAQGAFRAFYIRLTEVAKGYLERRLGAPVLEMTTTETLGLLRGHAHGDVLLPVTRDLAEVADRIKFAKGEGLGAEAERHLAAVRALVPALEARLRPPAPEAPEKGKAA
jgi:hypothetical protein